MRPRVGLLAHEPLLYRDLSGRENLRFYARLYDVAEPEARIAHLLESTGMSRRADEPVRNLSRGMAQRLGDLPRGAASRPSCCSWTSRARTSTRKPPRWRSR